MTFRSTSVRHFPTVGVYVAITALFLAGCSPFESDVDKADSTAKPGSTNAVVDGDPWAAIPELVARIEAAVVTITTNDGTGSGVVYKESGVIVTNQHVVGSSREVVVSFADGSQAAGHVIATDRATDLAIVQAEREDLLAARFATELPRRGELVLAIGTPLGFENSVTVGVVSGVGREIPGSAGRSRALVDLIQTDAAISPGNSGGALVGADGAVVGINEAYLPPQTGAVALGFAIPSPTVTDTVNELLEDGTASHAYLGIEATTLTRQLAELQDSDVSDGVLVLEVAKGSPASAAGIRRGDIIVRTGQEATPSVEALLGTLQSHDPGDTIEVTIARGDRRQDLEVRLAEVSVP